MDPSLPHTRGVGGSEARLGGSARRLGSEARLCGCGFRISGTDSHQFCSSCLGLEHAQEAIDIPRFVRALCPLHHQEPPSGWDPFMSVDSPAGNRDMVATAAEIEPRAVSGWGSTTAVAAESEPHAVSSWGPVAARAARAEPRAVSNWGSQMDLTMVPPAEDVLQLDYMEEDEEDASEFLLSDSDEHEDDIFVSSAQAAKPDAMSAPPGESTPASPCLSMDLQTVCQRAASRLDPWPEVAT
ncbi:hypothetical protein CesoFtcFv8_024115 [Champsocephalus esox]|uniref:Uncharacterized protein n=1 Tax=Champsocephalus esox TaxID=159716 RepID=A0AAN8B5S2_9TELE|nr:hypothetical protein CesoFtcFv8_024115 [Champsocephalus esox]